MLRRIKLNLDAYNLNERPLTVEHSGCPIQSLYTQRDTTRLKGLGKDKAYQHSQSRYSGSKDFHRPSLGCQSTQEDSAKTCSTSPTSSSCNYSNRCRHPHNWEEPLGRRRACRQNHHRKNQLVGSNSHHPFAGDQSTHHCPYSKIPNRSLHKRESHHTTAGSNHQSLLKLDQGEWPQPRKISWENENKGKKFQH